MADDTNTEEREAVARAIWAFMREHEDRCDEELEDLSRYHPVWEYADAARASLAASAGSEPVAWRYVPSKVWGDKVFTDDPVRAEDARQAGCIVEPLYTHPSPPEGMAGWISVDERLPEVGVTVLVYEPFRHGEDWPGTVRISFDHICPDYEGWHDHCASYEHFMAVGGVNACGPDVTCIGPSEKAPYTHWMPLPAPPLPASEAKEL